MNILIELLNDVDFSSINIDELLDERDSKAFDTEWIRVYRALESLKNPENYGTSEKRENANIRETVFMNIYSRSNDGALAEYISDDFGLIADAKLLGYNDAWLEKLIACYENKTIPSGKL